MPQASTIMTVIAGLLLFSSSLLNTKPTPIFADVYIDTHGPYRFLVDTGAQTSLIDPKLAAELGLKPEFRGEVITQNSTRLLPGMKVSALHIGPRTLADVELVFHDVTEARRLDSSVRGLLGINALTGFNFTLSSAASRLDLTSGRPAGELVSFNLVEGRIALKTRMGGETLTLILDSGSSHIVLFRTPDAMAKTPPVSTTFGTLDGARSVVPTCWTAEMFFTDRLRVGMLPAAIVTRKDTRVDGLLPASVFKKIYVDQDRSELVLVR